MHVWSALPRCIIYTTFSTRTSNYLNINVIDISYYSKTWRPEKYLILWRCVPLLLTFLRNHQIAHNYSSVVMYVCYVDISYKIRKYRHFTGVHYNFLWCRVSNSIYNNIGNTLMWWILFPTFFKSWVSLWNWKFTWVVSPVWLFPLLYKEAITKDISSTSVFCGPTVPSANLPGCLHCGSIICNGKTIRLYGPAPHLLEWRQHVI